jgi:hypothetical protein
VDDSVSDLRTSPTKERRDGSTSRCREPSSRCGVSLCMSTTLTPRPMHATWLGIIALRASACATPISSSEAAALVPGDADVAPSYAELFDAYFDKGTPGHCATSGRHADPGNNVWLCTNKDTCYQGMTDVGLIETREPTHSDNCRRQTLTAHVDQSGRRQHAARRARRQRSRSPSIEACIAAGAMND